jgi:hypothetical protein
MVCFVHDRQFLSKFHAAVNKLRQTNEFTTLTLQQLPKQCCSCPEKRNNMASAGTQPLLSSLNIDALQLVCLQLELKRCITTNVLPSSSEIHDYTILSFPTSLPLKEQAIITKQFIIQQKNEISFIEKMHHVCLEFVTSTASEELLNEVFQWTYDLVVKSSNYLEATQAINGLWVIISTKDQSRIDIVKHALQNQWKRFITNINAYSLYAVHNDQQNLSLGIKNNRYLNLQRSKNKRQQISKKQEKRRQVMQAKQQARQKMIRAKQRVQQQMMRILYAREEPWEESEDINDDVADDFVENVLVSNQPQLQFLFNRYQNSNKCRRPRTHRRQHILALAMVA